MCMSKPIFAWNAATGSALKPWSNKQLLIPQPDWKKSVISATTAERITKKPLSSRKYHHPEVILTIIQAIVQATAQAIATPAEVPTAAAGRIGKIVGISRAKDVISEFFEITSFARE